MVEIKKNRARIACRSQEWQQRVLRGLEVRQGDLTRTLKVQQVVVFLEHGQLHGSIQPLEWRRCVHNINSPWMPLNAFAGRNQVRQNSAPTGCPKRNSCTKKITIGVEL